MTTKEMMQQLLQELQRLEQHTKDLQTLSQSFERKKEIDTEARNKTRRIERRKKQLKDDMGKTISLIKSGYWKFSEATRLKEPGYVWECCDSDGIKIVGKVKNIGTDITFVFPDEKIVVSNKFTSDLERAVNSISDTTSIREWRLEKYSRYGFVDSDDYSSSYKNTRYVHTKAGRCIYCGADTSGGSACDTCRDRYKKKRHGVGGYPSVDPYAKGNNGDKYYNHTKK